MDADSKWLGEQITIPEEHMDNFQEEIGFLIPEEVKDEWK